MNAADTPRIEVIRHVPGCGFAMTETAVRSVGRGDVFADVTDGSGLAAARKPILAFPVGGTWNFMPDGPSSGAAGAVEHAGEVLGGFDRLTLAFDCTGEGFQFDPAMHGAFGGGLARHGITREQCLLLTSRTDGVAGYERWCRTYDQRPLFHPVYSPAQLYLYAGTYRQAHDLDRLTRLLVERSPALSGPRARKYVCLNFMPRENRWAVVLRLMQAGVLDDGFVSFQGRSPEVTGIEGDLPLDTVRRWLRDLRVDDALIARVGELDTLAPLTLDEPPADRSGKAYGLADGAYYAQSYFSIVNESDFFVQAGRRFSEKILKPIVNLQPFVAVATPGVLAELRRLGFKTFAPLIDESYDDINDSAARLEAATKSALALIAMDSKALHQLYAELWPRLVHNYLHFLCGVPSCVDCDEALLALSHSTECGMYSR